MYARSRRIGGEGFARTALAGFPEYAYYTVTWGALSAARHVYIYLQIFFFKLFKTHFVLLGFVGFALGVEIFVS